MSTLTAHEVTIRAAGPADSAGVRRLAALDSAPVPAGPLLLAEGDGRLLAALSISDGHSIADPFAETADIVALLAIRAGGRPMDCEPRRRAGRWRRGLQRPTAIG